MNFISFLSWVNDELLVLPTVVLFFGISIILTLKTHFAQIRAFPRFLQLIAGGVQRQQEGNTISSFHALFTAMATTIGMGNVVGPSIAIMTGGPGALFWLVAYMFFGSVIKFIAVTFALYTRVQTSEGNIIGGPMQYLKLASPFLAQWYSHLVIILFLIWSSLQANTLASVLAYEYIPQGVTGLGLALFVYVVLSGGARRVGILASRLVPFMFFFYVLFALFILFKDISALKGAILLVLQSITSRTAAIGGFAGASIFYAMQSGVLRGILITEAGLGTSSIPHAIADTKRPTDQGILAMCSTAADATLSILSGLLILVTGVWTKGEFRSTLIYEAFRLHSPFVGRYILVLSISLFVITTVMGNGFNGMQSFSVLTRYRWIKAYIIFASIVVFIGALMPVPLVWQLADLIMIMIAVPNLFGLLMLTFRIPKVLDIES